MFPCILVRAYIPAAAKLFVFAGSCLMFPLVAHTEGGDPPAEPAETLCRPVAEIVREM